MEMSSSYKQRDVDMRSLEYVEQINARTWTTRLVTSCIRLSRTLPALMDSKMAFYAELI